MSTDRWLVAWGLGSVALGAASLLVPLYFVAVGGGVVMLGVLAGVGAAAGAPGALLVGRVADRTGRRRGFVVGALATVAVVLAVLPSVSDPLLIVLANAAVWFAAGAAAPVLTLLVTVGHPESEWSDRFAVLNVYGGWGWAGGLVLGTVWTAVAGRLVGTVPAQRALLLVCAAAAGIAALLARPLLPPDSVDADAPRPARVARALARARRVPTRSATFPVGPARVYWLTRSLHPRRLIARLTPALGLYFAAVAVFFVGFGAFWGPLPLVLTDAGYGGTAVFALYLVSSVGSALFFRGAGRLANRYGDGWTQAAGLAVRGICLPAVALVGLALPASYPGLAANVALFAVVGLTWAVVAVTAATIVTRLAPAAIRGEALGVYTALSGLASGVGSLLGGWLAGRGFLLAFGVAGGAVLVGATLVAALWWRDRSATAVETVPS